MGHTQGCRRQILGHSSVATVELCRCGMVYLGIGPFTVRIEPAAFLALANTVIDASTELRRLQRVARDDLRLFLGPLDGQPAAEPGKPSLN